jgi:FAD/FMN-containing dehydrogenase
VLLEAEPTHGKEAMESWLAELFDSGMILDGVMAQSEAEAKHLWSLRENISESLCHMGIVHKNDISLPIAKLGDFLAKLRAAYTSAYPGIGVYTFGHLGDGNLHVSALKPSKVSKEEFVKLCHGADDIMYRLVQEHQGSISAEHGVGLLKKDHLHFSRTSREIELFRSLKRVFDPQGLLNPGKIFDPI